MRVSREKALENREQIIETAARQLRTHGFDGIGVADIMKAAGLTHGGFYRKTIGRRFGPATNGVSKP